MEGFFFDDQYHLTGMAIFDDFYDTEDLNANKIKLPVVFPDQYRLKVKDRMLEGRSRSPMGD